MTCAGCGLVLPAHARFCARCGAPQPQARRGVRAWVLVAFAVGIVVSAVGAIIYSAVAIAPGQAATNMDPAVIRTGSILLAGALAALCVVQSVAIAGLLRGREWGRVVATVACVAWSLTCVGLPVSIVVLNSIWRRHAGEPTAA